MGANFSGILLARDFCPLPSGNLYNLSLCLSMLVEEDNRDYCY
jgi:hypothetical protein